MSYFQGENFLSEKLLEEIVAGGCIYLIPAISRDLYFLRLAICSERITMDDIRYSFNVIKSCADQVMRQHFTVKDRLHKPKIDIDISPRRLQSTSSEDDDVDSKVNGLHISNGINGNVANGKH